MKENAAAPNPEGKSVEKPAGKSKPVKPKKPKQAKKSESIRLPFLLELTYTLSTLILVFLGLGIIVTSVLSGVGLFTIVLRTGVAILVVGGLLMLIASQVSSGLLFAARIEQEKAHAKQAQQEENQAMPEPISTPVADNASMAEA